MGKLKTIPRSRSMVDSRTALYQAGGQRGGPVIECDIVEPEMMLKVDSNRRRKVPRALTPTTLDSSRVVLAPSQTQAKANSGSVSRTPKLEGNTGGSKNIFGNSLRHLWAKSRRNSQRYPGEAAEDNPDSECISHAPVSSTHSRQPRKVSFQSWKGSRAPSDVEEIPSFHKKASGKENAVSFQPTVVPSGRSFNRAVFVRDDPFRILQVDPQSLGQGASGTVHIARAPKGQVMALKIIREPSKMDEDEVAIMQRVSHRALMKCYVSFYWNGALYVAMDLMDCGSLFNYISALRKFGSKMEEEHIAYIIRELLLGLDALHEEGIVHCDVKTDNVLISTKGLVKLSDFGSAILLDHTPQVLSRRGTPHWMAPEMSVKPECGATVTTKTDVWSVGIIAIELADWEPPLMNLSRDEILKMHQIGSFPQPKIESHRSFLFQDFVYQCTERNWRKRNSCKTMLRHPFLEVRCSRHGMAFELQSIIQRYGKVRSVEL